MGIQIVIVILLLLMAGLGGALAYVLREFAALRKSVRRTDLETHLLSEKLDYLRRELDKLDPDRGSSKSAWSATSGALPPVGSSPWAPPGDPQSVNLVIDPALLEDVAPLPGDRPESAHEPPVRLPNFRATEPAPQTPPRRSELLPELKPLVDLLPENMLEPEEEEPSVLPGSSEPESVHAMGAGSTAGFGVSSTKKQGTGWQTSLQDGLEPLWKWMRVTSEPADGATEEAIARVWLIRAAVLLLGGALVGLMIYLLPSMEPEYVTVLGCIAGIVCLSLSVICVDKGVRPLAWLFAAAGLYLTGLAMCHGAWESGVVPKSWAVAVIMIGALATTMAGERNQSLLLTGAGMAGAFAVPILLVVFEASSGGHMSTRYAAGLSVVMAALVHGVLSQRNWPVLRLLTILFAYTFVLLCSWHPLNPLHGIPLIAWLALVFMTQHVIVLFGPITLPRAAEIISFWLGAILLFLVSTLEIGAMFDHYGQIRALVVTCLFLIASICLADRYTASRESDRPAGVVLALCLLAMFVKVACVDLIIWKPDLTLLFAEPHGALDVASRCLNVAMVGVAFGLAARRTAATSPRFSRMLSGIAFVGVFTFSTYEVNTYLFNHQPTFQGAGLSFLWGVIGVLLTTSGVTRKQPLLSQFGCLFLGVMVIKVLAVDLGRMPDMLQRVLTLVGVGVILLAAAAPFFRRQNVNPSQETGHAES